jgi:hypothetical protein
MLHRRANMLASFVVIASALAHALAPSVKIFGRRGLAVAGAVAALALAAQRDFWLGFLGPAAFPGKVLAESTPRDATASVTVDGLPADAESVVYWAASATTSAGPRAAYADGTNAGVARAAGGKALLRLRCPGRYAVAGRALDAHVHYRVVRGGDRLIGAVQTARVRCAPPAVARGAQVTDTSASAPDLGGHAAFGA